MVRLFWTVTAFLLAALPSAMACPGCKEPVSVAGDGGLSGISLGFSASVLFMLGTIGSILGGMLWMIVRTCKQLDGRVAQPTAAVASRTTA